ncbi:MAG: four helix bundle protein [Ignavibacteriae bacterium]|nr:four helix bundle protein [Ignavibacteriota bacterium]
MKYLERNKNINRGFRKLEVWKEAIELFKYVKVKLDSFNLIFFKVKAQIEDSILSVSSNIAEGYCRRHIKENIQFNNIALASLGENCSQIYALFNSEVITEKWFNEYDAKYYSLENKLINYNRSQINMIKNKNEWKNDYVVKEMIEKYEVK